MSQGPTFPFLVPLPCYLVKFDDNGMVSVPASGSRGMALLTDIDLAERFAGHVTEESQRPTTLVEVGDRAALLTHLVEAKRLGASCLAMDPEFPAPGQCVSREVDIDHAIAAIQS
jgi:hypothetical protein